MAGPPAPYDVEIVVVTVALVEGHGAQKSKFLRFALIEVKHCRGDRHSSIDIWLMWEKYRPAASVMTDSQCERLITSHIAVVLQ